jgi:hypothetical protein
MTTLKMGFHGQTGRRIVEIYDDRGFNIGAIYPTDDGSNAVHIVSRYFAGEPTRPQDSNAVAAALSQMTGTESFLISFRQHPLERRPER